MDFDSPDVEKDFPGLYASESVAGKSRRKSKEDSDYSDGEHDKLSKKDLLKGRRKDKKDKGKDRGYAALEGESSPEEELLDTKSPSKTKKSKTFKFTSSKSKEKREKSRDKEKHDLKHEEEKGREKEKLEKEKKKEKEKEHKEKNKKEKTKEKDKKDKKLKQFSTASEEVLELGDVQPVFGVSVSLATERSRCHDGVDIPLVVRDCIDFLQQHALQSEQIYKVEPMKTRLQHFKRLYNNHEHQHDTDELDIPTACGLLKLFLREMPEPVLTTDLIVRFEEVASHQQITKQQAELQQLIEQLPKCNKTLLAWILLHFDAVLQHERCNKLNAQSLAMLLSPPLQMSHRLLVTLLCYCPNLFADEQLIKYVPPITASSPKLPENPVDIQTELRKQESLLAQIHSEMNAGFISKRREEQLWEVQRIITQLKRKYKCFEKKQSKSIDEVSAKCAPTLRKTISSDTTDAAARSFVKQTKLSGSDDDSVKTLTTEHAETHHEAAKIVPPVIPEEQTFQVGSSATAKQSAAQNSIEELYVDEASGFLMVPKTHPDYENLVRLQLENRELLAWKSQLQARITAERAEVLRLKKLHQQQLAATRRQLAARNKTAAGALENVSDDYDKIIERYTRENTLLEHKKLILAKEVFAERRACIALQVELAFQQF